MTEPLAEKDKAKKDGPEWDVERADDLASVAAGLSRSPPDRDALAHARARVEGSESPELLSALVLMLVGDDRAPASEGYLRALSALEAIAEDDPALGGVLMAYLYPHASRAFRHDVCDAIELWMDSFRDSILARRLRDLPADDPDFAVRLGRWAASVERPAEEA